MIPILQLESLVVTVVVFILSLVLTIILTKSYLRNRKPSSMFWSLGMWAFTIGMLVEILFAVGIQSAALSSFYLFIVAVLVEFLALGSIQLVKSNRIKNVYMAFCIISTVFLVYSFTASQAQSIVVNYVATGLPPLLVIYASSIITFPAAAVLAIVTLISYIHTKDLRNVSIIAGVVVVSVAGTLYIVSFPSLLYIAEFIGIVLLWIGFFRGKPKAKG